MRQQINLYQDILIDKPEPFIAKHAMAIGMLVFVILCLFSGYRYWQLSALEGELLRLQQTQEPLQRQVESLEKNAPDQSPDPLLLEKVSRLEAQVAEQKAVLSYFFHKEKDTNRFVLASLERLATISSSGLWLRQISFQEEGERIFLAGTALQAEMVPEYVATLGEKQVLGGRAFSQVQLKRPEDKGDRVEFELDSQQAAR